MKWFEHHNASSFEEVVELLNYYHGKAKIIAGGTDLLGALKDKVVPEYPKALINIKTVEGLNYIKIDENVLKIGALARLVDIVKSHIVREKYELLTQAAHSVATPHIRNMATIGGNLAQDVRCWFYRYPRNIGGPIECLRTEGKYCSALAGDNRYHSIFGAAPLVGSREANDSATNDINASYPSKARKGCFAVGPSDIAVALVALDANIVTTKRNLAAGHFFKATATKSTVLEADELIQEIQIPKPPAGSRQVYEKFTLRKPIDFAIVSVASVLTVDNGICNNARIVLGSVAPDPVRAFEAEDLIKGQRINEDIAQEAAALALAGAKPLRNNGYKMEIAETLVKHAVLS